jgi:hypothetical protein
LGEVRRSEREKKLQIPKPDAYDGSVDANPTYQRWYETINDYLYHNRGTWDGDSDLIRIVGAYLKGKARDWYDNRARQLRANRKIDSWPAFVSAMDERFTTSHEADAAFAKMSSVTYKNSVMAYIDELTNLNEKANISGRAWRNILCGGLPQELRKDLAKMQGGKPKEDDALVAAIKEVGLAHEEFLREEKLKEKSAPSGKQKGKRKREAEKSNASANEDKAPAGKKPKKDAAPVTGTGSPRFTKEQEDEALKGIPQNLRDARGNKGLCVRCGLPKHRWQWCRREISISSTRKTEKKGKGKKKEKKDATPEAPAASVVTLKRKAPANTVSVGIHPLPVSERILAYLRWKAGDSKRVRTIAAVASSSKGKVWEVDSQAEEV